MSKVNPTVLILCTGNSCRSHLAEGILRTAAGDSLNVQSAGSKPAGYVHPLAIQVMKEIGIDISGHRSKHMDEFLKQPVETVVTVCGNADQACPMFPGQVNRPFNLKSGARSTAVSETGGNRESSGQVSGLFGRSKRLKQKASSGQTAPLYRSGGN